MAEAMESTSGSFSTLRSGMSVSYSCNANMSSGGIGVKIGGLWKRSQGVKRFTKHNYKHRVFILTDNVLSYYGGTIDRVGQCKGRVQLDKIRAVEFVDIAAFNLAHSMQIVYHTKRSGFTTLYIIATTKEECADWVNTLRQACYFNQDMLMHFHPGALVRSKWTCCSQRGQATLGCQPTYHLLTRSSSRYAQIRRKDTLTSSQRLARLGIKKSATSSGEGTNQYQQGVLEDGLGASLQGQALSNSCMDLCTVESPVSKGTFSPIRQSAGNTSSQRSSRNSNDHSVGMGSILLTRVSVLASAAGDGEMGEGSSEDERRHGHQQDCGDLSDGSSLRSPVISRGKLGGRSQVAPAWTTSTSSSSSVPAGPIPSRYSYEYEHKTLPRSFKTRPVRNQERASESSLRISSSSPSRSPRQLRKNRSEESAGDSATPVAPPRVKRGVGTSVVSQASPVMTVSPITEHSLRARPKVPMAAAASSNRSPLKHSKTFTTHGRRLPSGSGGFSQSMGALARPLIEPKVSLSNPNIIHV